MHRSFLTIVLISLVTGSLLVAPATAQDAPGDLAPAGQHVIQYIQGGADGAIRVDEAFHLVNEADDDFSGSLWFSLDPESTLETVILSDASGTPYAGGAGSLTADDLTTTAGDETTRYEVDLADYNITLATDDRIRINLTYGLPADDTTFVRAFEYGTASLVAQITVPNGVRPTSDSTPLMNVPQTALYHLAPESERTFAAGETFTFTLEQVDEAAVPLDVALEAEGDDEVTLRADITGGIEPYTIRWFRDGALLEVDDRELKVSESDRAAYRIEVTDSAAPPTTESATATVVRGEAALPAPVPEGANVWLFALIGVVLGALLVYGLVAGGVLGPKPKETRPSGASSISAESREMLEVRKRTNMAALKELEIAKKKGEVPDGLYLPLKEELKGRTVRVMRELEKREKETV